MELVKLEPGKTLLLDGPASALVVSGRVSIFGAELGPRRRVVARMGRRLPLEAVEPSELEVVVGQGGSFSIVEGSSIPRSWLEAVEEAISRPSPTRIMVLGGVDVGKTSLCTLLANKALKAGRSVGLIDADVGQSDVGPPCTIGFARVEKPVRDLSTVRAEHVFFLGDKTPSYMVDRALEGLKSVLKAAEGSGVDFLILNTDGWIAGHSAAQYKKAMASIFNPDLILALHRGEELNGVLKALEDYDIRSLEVPDFVKERDRETRRELRAQGYRRYLEGAKVVAIQLDWVDVEGWLPGSGLRLGRERLALIRSVLGRLPAFCDETPGEVRLVFEAPEELPGQEELAELEELLEKPVRPVLKGEEEGLLVALYGKDNRFLGIGVVICVDYHRKAVKVYTPVSSDDVAKICVGRIRVDRNGNEVEGPRAPQEEGQASLEPGQ